MLPRFKLWSTLLCCQALTLSLTSSRTIGQDASNHLVANPSASPHPKSPSKNDNASAPRDAGPYCDAGIFGHPHLSSCRDAVETIPDAAEPLLSFGNRPKQDWISVTVPYRFVSRKSMGHIHCGIRPEGHSCAKGNPADGTCVIEIGFSSPYSSLRFMTSRDIRVAASSIVSSCVENRGVGGVVKLLGRSNSRYRFASFYAELIFL